MIGRWTRRSVGLDETEIDGRWSAGPRAGERASWCALGVDSFRSIRCNASTQRVTSHGTRTRSQQGKPVSQLAVAVCLVTLAVPRVKEKTRATASSEAIGFCTAPELPIT